MTYESLLHPKLLSVFHILSAIKACQNKLVVVMEETAAQGGLPHRL
jgi:hypothetical protein